MSEKREGVNNWFVVTGAPSSGKTTVIQELARNGYNVVPEAGRVVIDRAIEDGISVEELRADTKLWQRLVIEQKQQFESTLDPHQLTFFDRGMHDSLAYMRSRLSVPEGTEHIMQRSMYRAVFLLESLPDFEQDYARTEDESFSKTFVPLLRASYADYGMEPVDIPLLSPEDRVRLILGHVASLDKSFGYQD